MGVRSTSDVTREEAIAIIRRIVDDLEDRTDEEIHEIINNLTADTCDNYRIVTQEK